MKATSAPALALFGLLASAVAVAAPAGQVLPPPSDTEQVGVVSNIIYLERCKNGCTITKGFDDAKTLHSSIPEGAASEYPLDEFQNSQGQTGAAADAEWAAVVKCVQEIYSPFNVHVTDVKPTNATSYHTNVVAGRATQLGLSSGIGGISPGVSCNPVDNRVTFTFANTTGGSGMERIYEVCAIAGQESAHTWGLDHAYAYPDGSSSCNDPMTYRGDCGGQKFFRNVPMTCGEYTGRPCYCGATQNAHLLLTAVFGPGTPLTTPPAVTVTLPVPNAMITNGTAVVATASAQRGVASLELWLNGYKWGSVKGAKFGPLGQPESSYSLPIPADVPDGIIDIVVKAKDDIDITTATPPVTVTKGAPCATADTCADGQRCDAGRCLWDPAVGNFGDDCSYPQYCLSGVCQGTADKTICTQSCVVGVSDACPDASYECLETSPNKGICWPKGATDKTCGGCAASGSDVAPFAFGVFGLALVLRRRRR